MPTQKEWLAIEPKITRLRYWPVGRTPAPGNTSPMAHHYDTTARRKPFFTSQGRLYVSLEGLAHAVPVSSVDILPPVATEVHQGQSAGFTPYGGGP